jgi:hypothetical protein
MAVICGYLLAVGKTHAVIQATFVSSWEALFSKSDGFQKAWQQPAKTNERVRRRLSDPLTTSRTPFFSRFLRLTHPETSQIPGFRYNPKRTRVRRFGG